MDKGFQADAVETRADWALRGWGGNLSAAKLCAYGSLYALQGTLASAKGWGLRYAHVFQLTDF